MNERLQLRWMIAMLEHASAHHPPGFDALSNRTSGVLTDLQAELATLQRFHDEAVAEGKNAQAKDELFP